MINSKQYQCMINRSRIMNKTHKRVTTTTPPANEDFLSKCLSDKCRVCLKTGEILIFGTNDIASVVQEFGGIQLSEEDNRPKLLCDICHSLLEGAIIFRHTAQKSEQILLKINEYLIGQNKLALPPTYSEQESSNLDIIISNIKKLTDTMFSERTECSNVSGTSEPHSGEPNMMESDSDASGNNKCEYLEFSNFSSDEESEKDFMHKDSKVKYNNSDKDDGSLMSVEMAEQDKDCRTIGNKSNHVNKSVTCPVCQKEVGIDFYKNHMKLHRELYKKKRKNASRRMECEICHKVVSYTYYKNHMKMHGSDDEQARRFRKCPLCDKMFSANYYNEHMKRVHDNNVLGIHKANGPKLIPMDTSPTRTSKLDCPVCDKKVKQDQYAEHLAKHGKSPKKYVCDKCGMTTRHSSSFKTHCLTHGSELKYKCQYCPYRGLHVGLLRIHERTHTKEYNYKCHICSAKFLTKSNLGQHQRVHRLPIDFICEECNRGFYTRRALDRHYKSIHLKDKSHVCEICSRGFGHQDTLLSHQLKVHKRRRMLTKGRLPSYLRPEQIIKQEQSSG